jgi:hypothetical protein
MLHVWDPSCTGNRKGDQQGRGKFIPLRKVERVMKGITEVNDFFIGFKTKSFQQRFLLEKRSLRKRIVMCKGIKMK